MSGSGFLLGRCFILDESVEGILLGCRVRVKQMDTNNGPKTISKIIILFWFGFGFGRHTWKTDANNFWENLNIVVVG